MANELRIDGCLLAGFLTGQVGLPAVASAICVANLEPDFDGKYVFETSIALLRSTVLGLALHLAGCAPCPQEPTAGDPAIACSTDADCVTVEVCSCPALQRRGRRRRARGPRSGSPACVPGVLSCSTARPGRG